MTAYISLPRVRKKWVIMRGANVVPMAFPFLSELIIHNFEFISVLGACLTCFYL